MKSFISLLLGATTVLAAGRTTAPAGCLHVAKSGGAFTTVQAAVDSLSLSSTAAQCIFVDQGTYKEQVNVAARKAQLTIYGYTAETSGYAGNKAIITNSLDSKTAGNNDKSGTLRVSAANFKMYNIDVINDFGAGSDKQAIALSAQASSGYYGCSFRGFQDTLLANEGHQYYEKCQITGGTDYVFGRSAVAWFQSCDLRSRAGGSYVTANGRDSASNPSYFVFDSCTVSAASGETVGTASVYLGRPWGTYSRTVFQKSSLSAIINPAGWHAWTTSDPTGNVFYKEFANTGAGASGTRVSFAGKLTAAVKIGDILGSSYSSQGYYDGNYA